MSPFQYVHYNKNAQMRKQNYTTQQSGTKTKIHIKGLKILLSIHSVSTSQFHYSQFVLKLRECSPLN